MPEGHLLDTDAGNLHGGDGIFGAGAAGKTPAGPPNPVEGFFPLSEVHRGLMGTAWTVFTGDKPEPMQVEILGVLRGARGRGTT